MSVVSILCFTICILLISSLFRNGSDILSPARLFAIIWSLAVGLADLKLSAFQRIWTVEGWFVLLLGPLSLLGGLMIAWVLHLHRRLTPIETMRRSLRVESIHEGRLFWSVFASAVAYAISYAVIFLIKGWLPIFVVGSRTSRVEFNVIGFTVLLYSAGFIVFFTLLSFMLVRGNRIRKWILVSVSLLSMGSYFLLLQRFQVIMAAVICLTLLYYSTHFVRWRTVLPLFAVVAAFFYAIMSFRLGNLLMTYTYWASKMRIPIELSVVTEPYMYVVMNLENFARSVSAVDHHTFGYFTFDFAVSLAGLEGMLAQYFNIDRTPYLISYYNTYTGFWPFYRDFGIVGLMFISLACGLVAGLVYYQMRMNPSVKTVTAYAFVVFVIIIFFFVFPVSFLWFQYNMLAVYLILRFSMGSKHRMSPV